MKCANCGAELKVGCIYCSVCGHEAQFVPDYNVLEDDYLKKLLEEENKEKKQPAVKKVPPKKQKKKKKKTWLIPVILLILVIIGLGVTFIVKNVIYNKHANSFEYQYNQGILAEKDREYAKAETYLNRALELKKEHTGVMKELAKVYAAQKKDADEENMLLQLLLLEPQDKDAYEMLIELYDEKQQYDKILDLYEKAKDTKLNKLFADYVVMPPEFSEEEGDYDEEMSVTLKAQSGCEIYYVIGNGNPVDNGMRYEQAIELKEGETTISAVAKDSRGIYSDVVTATYTITFKNPEPPTASPLSGSYNMGEAITVTVPKDCEVYYTWDGETPSEASAHYEAPLEMPEGNNVLSLIAINKHGLSSRVAKYNYIYLPE